MKERQWFSLEMKSKDGDGDGDNKKKSLAEIVISDFIGDWIDDYWGFGVTAKSFLSQLASLPEHVDTIRVRINSPGGDVYSALAIANALRAQRSEKGRTVETIVDGLAASAATLITMAGAPARMSDNAIFMVHNPWSIAAGNASEMRKAADSLDKVRDALVATYQWHATELSVDELVELLDAETWMDANDAKEYGFIDEIDEGLKMSASLDPRAIDKLAIPEKFAERVKACLRVEDGTKGFVDFGEGTKANLSGTVDVIPKPAANASPSDVLDAVYAAGLDLTFARALISEGLAADAVSARIESASNAKKAEEKRADDVRAMCSQFKLDSFAPHLVAMGATFDASKQLIAQMRSALDRVEIDSTLHPDGGHKNSAPIDIQAWFAERNGISPRKE